MELTAIQIIPVLDNIYKEVKSNVNSLFYGAPDGTCNIKVDSEGGLSSKLKFVYVSNDVPSDDYIELEKQGDRLMLEIHTGGNNIAGYYQWRIAVFSPVWWKWRRIVKLINSNLKTLIKLKDQLKKNEYDIKFNDAYATVFPDEINKILLGEFDD